MSGSGHRRKILALAAALLLGALAFYGVRHSGVIESEQLDYTQTAWQSCRSDDDCVVAPSVCPGFFWSINGKFVADNLAQNARLAPLIECGPPPADIRPLRPYCQSGQCVMPRQP